MKITAFNIAGPLLIEPSKFHDERGFVSEVYNERLLKSHLGDIHFVQDNHTLSEMTGTIRGLHFQKKPAEQGKLVRVVRGAIFDVAVDIRADSRTFGEFASCILSASNWRQLWVPSGFAHGFCTMEPWTEVEYKLTGYYNAECSCGIQWNDPALGIPWRIPKNGAIVSRRDQCQPLLADLPRYF